MVERDKNNNWFLTVLIYGIKNREKKMNWYLVIMMYGISSREKNEVVFGIYDVWNKK